MKHFIVLDTTSLYYAVERKHGDGAKIDYTKLKEKYIDSETLRLEALGTNAGKSQGFIDYLKINGYAPKFVAAPEHRPNCTTHIIVSILKLKDRIDKVTIFTSDYQIAPFITFLIESGIQVHVIGVGLPKEIKNTTAEVTEITSDCIMEAE